MNRKAMKTQLKKSAVLKNKTRGIYALKMGKPRKKAPLIEFKCLKNVDSIKGAFIFVLRSHKSIFPDCPFLFSRLSFLSIF